MTAHHDRAMQAIRSIDRLAWRLATEPRRRMDDRARDAWVIERQLKVLVIAVEAAYRQNGNEPPKSPGGAVP